MRVLLVHSFYRSNTPSGEARVFHEEKNMLERKGIEVETFTVHSDEMLKLGFLAAPIAAISMAWNPFSAWKIRKKIRQFKPDVVHVHNTFPWLSPAIFYAIGKQAASVLTLHNYRLFCPAAIPARQGRVCVECLEKRSSWPSIKHGCYRNSRPATLPLAFSVSLHRKLGTWNQQVDAFIALTEFQKQVMTAAGLPQEKVHVKPNFVAGNPEVRGWDARERRAVFVGRLSTEKGVHTLLKAWRAWGAEAPELCIVGDGDLRTELEAMAVGLPVQFMGALSNEEAREHIARSQLLIVPSEWFEGFAIVLAEAFALGTPVAVSEIRPLPVIVNAGLNGVTFRVGDAEALLNVVREAWQKPGYLEELSYGARACFEGLYNEEANYLALMRIYQNAIKVSRHG